MKAIILSAGQGSRLLPMTEELPKCLLPLAAMTVLEWQITRLDESGFDEIVVVTGFMADKVEVLLNRLQASGINVRSLFNPFFKVADNLGSCWLARHEMNRDFLILNGDTIFEQAVLARLLQDAEGPISLAADYKQRYDSDDMKIHLSGEQILAVGKDLPDDKADGESIGMIMFKGHGPQLFAAALDSAMQREEGTKSWYLRVISGLAQTGAVRAVSIHGHEWGEIDYPADLKNAQNLTQRWLERDIRDMARYGSVASVATGTR